MRSPLYLRSEPDPEVWVTGLGHELYTPLFNAAVVAYARPFSGNKGTGTLSRHWSEFADQRLRVAHKKLIVTRNQLVAHSDSTVRSVTLVPPGVSFGGKVSDSVAFRINGYGYGWPVFVDMQDTCSFQIVRMDARIDELLALLYSDAQLPPHEFPLTLDDAL